MSKTFTISVKSGGAQIKTIKRKVYAEQIGNFNPIFCRFNKSIYLVKSEAGDLSDPFRREENYANSLFIELDNPCARTRI